MGDVHSSSILVRSTVANLKFGYALRDPGSTRSLTKLYSLGAANTWTLLTSPNLPVWPSGGNFSSAQGVAGYILFISLAVGSTNTAPANDTWQNGNFYGAIGQDNFASKPVNSTFDIAFVQHEPGALCTTPIDCPFGQNLDGDMGCLRYFTKSYPYGFKAGTVTDQGSIAAWMAAGGQPFIPVQFKRTMAKAPSVTLYSPTTGAVNTYRDIGAGVDRAVASIGGIGDGGFSTINPSAAGNAGAWAMQAHYTADTGW
jgi:hypothetical protein